MSYELLREIDFKFHLKVTDMNASLGDRNGLIEFMVYSESHPDKKKRAWYLLDDKAFQFCGIDNSGLIRNVLPKRSESDNSAFQIFPDPALLFVGSGTGLFSLSDSVYIIDTPHTMLEFPLKEGAEWEVYSDDSRSYKRRVTGREHIIAGGNSYYCWVIENADIKPPKYREWEYDYINHKYGLVKREMSYSFLFLSDDSTWRYGYANDVIELINKY